MIGTASDTGSLRLECVDIQALINGTMSVSPSELDSWHAIVSSAGYFHGQKVAALCAAAAALGFQCGYCHIQQISAICAAIMTTQP